MNSTTTMVPVRVRAFAHAGALLQDMAQPHPDGGRVIELALPSPSNVAGLHAVLASHLPPLKNLLPHCRLAHNHAFMSDQVCLQAGDEVVILPPVSGG